MNFVWMAACFPFMPTKASTNNVGLKGVDVVIPNVLADNPVLNVDGKANGTLQNFVGFVNATPVIDWIGHLTDETTATGNADLLLEMQLPLEKMESPSSRAL